jgi:hypothetical protein
MAQQLNLDRSQRVDIVCRKGDTFTLNLELKDEAGVAINVSGHTFLMQVRTSEDDNPAANDLPGAILAPTADASTNGASGLVKFSVAATAMQAVNSGLYVYDISQNNGTTGADEVEETILYGTFKVNEDISIT